MIETKDIQSDRNDNAVSGHLARRLYAAPWRILAIVSGFALVRGIIGLVGRFLLGYRRKATAKVMGKTLMIDEEWRIFGRNIRKASTVSQLKDIGAVRFENRKRYIYLLIGFGFMSIGAWFGIQYLLDSFRAGFAQLALVGAGIVTAGVLIDLALYLFVPEGKGTNRLIMAVGPWQVRLAGVDSDEAENFVEVVRSSFS